ncbi:MAG: DUF2798 domain-containing protein [Pseudomonadota bacterium]
MSAQIAAATWSLARYGLVQRSPDSRPARNGSTNRLIDVWPIRSANAGMQKKSLIWRLVHTGLLSGGMSALVALIVTIVNTGLDGALGGRWLVAWSLAYPVAWFAALIWGPSARMLTNWLLGSESKS